MSDQARVSSHGAEAPRPLGEIVRDVLEDIRHIVHSEVRLARTELGEKVNSARNAAGLIGAAAVAGLLAGACLVTTCIAALALVMPLWLAALIMGIVLGIAAAGAFAVGRGRLSAIDPVPNQTIHTLEDNIEWAQQRNRH